MLAMSSTSSSSHQPTNPLFLASNLVGSSSSPWPLLLEDPLATLLPNYHNQHNLLATHFPPYQAFATHSSSHDHHHYQSSTSPPPNPPPMLPPFADLPDRQREDEEEEVRKDSSSGGGGTVTTTMKKLNHNASERYRRKKINTLYSSLRVMLPPSDHHSATKKLSIPTTVSRVLKYIPELQQQVEALARKKEMLLSSSSAAAATTSNRNQQLDDKQDHVVVVDRHHMNVDQAKSFTSTSSSLASSPSTVSTSWLSEREVMVQISVAGDDTGGSTFQVSEILLHLQETGLVLVNSSSFRSFHGRVFYNLHLKVEGTHGVALDREALSEKLLNLYEHRSF